MIHPEPRNDSGQAATEYALVMVSLVVVFYLTKVVFGILYPDAFSHFLSAFGIYSASYDLVLSLPFP